MKSETEKEIKMQGKVFVIVQALLWTVGSCAVRRKTFLTSSVSLNKVSDLQKADKFKKFSDFLLNLPKAPVFS